MFSKNSQKSLFSSKTADCSKNSVSRKSMLTHIIISSKLQITLFNNTQGGLTSPVVKVSNSKQEVLTGVVCSITRGRLTSPVIKAHSFSLSLYFFIFSEVLNHPSNPLINQSTNKSQSMIGPFYSLEYFQLCPGCWLVDLCRLGPSAESPHPGGAK